MQIGTKKDAVGFLAVATLVLIFHSAILIANQLRREKLLSTYLELAHNNEKALQKFRDKLIQIMRQKDDEAVIEFMYKGIEMQAACERSTNELLEGQGPLRRKDWMEIVGPLLAILLIWAAFYFQRMPYRDEVT